MCVQGIGKLSLVAQSAANVVQSGTKEITAKVICMNMFFVFIYTFDKNHYMFCVGVSFNFSLI